MTMFVKLLLLKKTHTFFFFFRERDFLLPGFLQSAVSFGKSERSCQLARLMADITIVT